MIYQDNILEKTRQNSYFRQVLFTGDKSQLVVMEIKPGEDIGTETHSHVEQILFFLSGAGKVVADGRESTIKAGDVVIVKPGTEHNFVNTGSELLKIYTIHCPPNHIDSRVHKTKLEADEDVADEDFGHSVK